MAVKIRLLRMGKIRNPQYRIVVADSRTKRDGKAIEFIGLYHPKEEPSRIEVKSDRAQYWLGVGAQPSQPVQRILELTGDWQKFKNLPAPPPLKVAAATADRKAIYEAEAQAAAGIAPTEAKPAKKAEKKAEPKAEAKAEAEAEGRRPRPRSRRRRPRPRSRPVPTPASKPDGALRPALEHLVKGIVEHPDDVRVRMIDGRRGQRLEVRVHPDDLGTVIGRGGRTAKALRQVITSIGGRAVRVDIIDAL